MKTLALVLCLLLSTTLFAPSEVRVTAAFEPETVEMLEEIQYEKDEDILDYNLVRLKDDIKRSRKEMYELVQPVIDVYLRRNTLHTAFPNIADSLSHALTCIFISESSNRKGHTGRSSLWLEYNNPFGLTAHQGVTKTSWEMINGKRVVMDVTFRMFDSFEEAINSLMWDYLYKKRYINTINSVSVKDFLYNLYEDGYMTNSGWPKFAYKEIFLKCNVQENS